MYYKFLDTKDIDKVLINRTVIISSLEYFRRLEETEWADIGDPLEGASEVTINDDLNIRENSPELALVNNTLNALGMFEKFAKVSDGGVIHISTSRFIYALPQLFIYSVSAGDLGELTTRMCVNSKRHYDACLRVHDLEGLQREILECGRIRNLDCAVGDIFWAGLIKPVEYEPRSRDIREGPAIQPSPFKKSEKFVAQSEVRVLFVPKEGKQISEQRLIIEMPRPTTFFIEEFRSYDRSKIASAAHAF
jgi:hypothetical protein